MTTIEDPDVLVAERICAICKHSESDHVVVDVEQETKKRERCLVCDDWHAFVPMAD